jgi:hypothetical protein
VHNLKRRDLGDVEHIMNPQLRSACADPREMIDREIAEWMRGGGTDAE